MEEDIAGGSQELFDAVLDGPLNKMSTCQGDYFSPNRRRRRWRYIRSIVNDWKDYPITLMFDWREEQDG